MASIFLPELICFNTGFTGLLCWIVGVQFLFNFPKYVTTERIGNAASNMLFHWAFLFCISASMKDLT